MSASLFAFRPLSSLSFSPRHLCPYLLTALLVPGASFGEEAPSGAAAEGSGEMAAEETPTPADATLAKESEVIEVVERAVARQDAAAFSNLTREELEEGGFKDIPTLLSETPSIMWYSESGNGIGYNYLSIRGFDQRRIGVTIDGVPQNDPEDHNVYWVNVYDLAGSLEDVQVQRGGGSAFYGPPAIGGAINMVTRRFSDEAFGRADVGVGVFEPSEFGPQVLNAQRYGIEANSGLINDKFVFYGRLSHVRSEGYRDWSWARFNRGFVGMEWRGTKHSLRAQVYGGPQNDALSYYGIPKSYNEDPELRRTNWGSGTDIERFSQTHVDLIDTLNINDRVILKNTLFYLRGAGYFDFAGYWGSPDYFRFEEALPEDQAAAYYLDPEDPAYEAIPSDTLIRAWVDLNQVGWLPQLLVSHDRGQHILGGEFRVNRSNHWGRIEDGSFPIDDTPYLVGDEANHQFYAYKAGTDIASVYGGESLSLGDVALTGNIQLRGMKYRFFDEAWVGNNFEVPYFFINPRIGVNYNVSPRFNAYASVSRTRREPRLANYYEADSASWGVEPAFAPNPDGTLNFESPLVSPETLIDYEGGVGWLGPKLRLNLGAFYMDFQDEIVPTGGLDIFGQPITANAEKSVHAGLEAEAAASLPIEGVELAGSFTGSRNRFEDFVEYCEDDSVSEAVPIQRAGNAIAAFPDLMGNARLSYRSGGGRIALTGRYVGRQYTDNSQDTWCDGTPANGAKVVDPYVVMGASAGYAFKESGPVSGLTLSLDVNNLTNNQVLLAGYGEDFFPLGTRNYFLRATYDF